MEISSDSGDDAAHRAMRWVKNERSRETLGVSRFPQAGTVKVALYAPTATCRWFAIHFRAMRIGYGRVSARQMYDELDEHGKRRNTVGQIAAEIGVTRPTIYPAPRQANLKASPNRS